ncbi:MAG TPA: sugar ABC transporter permease [Rectinemataceae bacterium]|nr:sugar ABC transporter permease [Rectinemataceae bacterium]
MNIVLMLFIAVVGVPLVLVGYIRLSEPLAGRNPRRAANLRPWLWLAPTLLLLSVFLVYPVIATIIASLKDADSTHWIGLANYATVFTSADNLSALGNNLLWLVFFTLGTLLFGLLIAVLSDKVRYESVVKALVFIPMAISFVAAGIIWKFMFEFRPAGEVQVGTVNAILTVLVPGWKPIAWLVNTRTNNAALIAVGVWMWTGFAMVILSAAIKAIPPDVVEAAKIDGASELQIFRMVTLPLVAPTLGFVATTMMINVLKVFDIVYVMTNGNLGTDVIANRMYKEMFNYHNTGVASAIATFLLVCIVPVMIVNIRRYRRGVA